MKPVALQLYTLREALAQDFEGVIRRIAAMGYAGVETAGIYGDGPTAAARLFEELGLRVCSAHSDPPLGDTASPVLETMAALRCTTLVVPYIPPEEFTSEEKIKAHCERLNEANRVAQANGLTLAYHNHDWEFRAAEVLGGRRPFDIMLDLLDPTVQFEIDTYWVAVGGSDPLATVQMLGARAGLLHIKDGPLDRDLPMQAVGAGKMDFPPIIAASEAQWLIVELDHCATDMLEAVQQSYTYLTDGGLARGR